MNCSINIVSLFLTIGKEYLKTIAKRIKKEKDFKSFFLNANNEFVFNELNSDYFDETMQQIFSTDNLKKIASECAKINGFDMKDKIIGEIQSIFKEMEIETSDYRFFQKAFFSRFEEFLKTKYPELYEQHLLSKMENDIIVNFDIVIKSLSELKEAIIENKSKLYSSIIEYEMKLFDSTKRNISLDFFESDDLNFKSEFQKLLLSQVVTIKIRCFDMEESLYSVLYEIKKSNIDKKVRIVDSIDSWKELAAKSIDNTCIYIAYFDSEVIDVIPNCINIFFYDDDVIDEKYIILRNKKGSTIVSSLKNIGYSEEEALRLVDDTNGVFCCLKNELFYGKYTYPYSEEINKNVSVLKGIIIGSWVDNSRDIDLFGKDYKLLKKSVNIYYSKKRNPLFVLKKKYGNIIYKITDRKKALFQFRNQLSDYLDIFLEDIINIINYDYTNELKSSFLKNLLIIKNENMNYEEELISKIDNVIMKVFNVCSIRCIGEQSFLLAELNPRGYIDLFKNRKEEILIQLKTAHGMNLIYPLRTFLAISDYANECLLILLDLYNEDMLELNKNSIDQIIKASFLTWINVSSIKNDDKVDILRNVIEKKEYAKEIINNALNQNSVLSSYHRLYFLKTDEMKSVTYTEYSFLFKEYLEIFIDYITTYEDVNYILEMLEKATDNIFKNENSRLVSKINSFVDDEKEKIYYKITKIISQHRFHKKASWARNENYLSLYIALREKIIFDNPLYKYKYVFRRDDRIPLLNPSPFEKGNYYSENQEKTQILVNNTIESIKEEGFSLFDLLILFRDERCSIGTYIFNVQDGGDFNEKTFILLLKSKKEEVIKDYVYCFANTNYEAFLCTLKLAKEEQSNDQLIADIWRLRTISDIDNNLDKESIEVKKCFWKGPVFTNEHKNLNVFNWLTENILKYGSYSEYISLLCSYEDISEELLYDRILKITEFEDLSVEYLLVDILKKISSYVKADESRFAKIAEIEYELLDYLDFEGLDILKDYCNYNPKYYLEFINQYYKHDHYDGNIKIKNNLYGLFLKVHFCPGMKNGTIDETLFYKWITEFKKGLDKQDQNSMFSFACGKILGNSPHGSDNCYPHEVIRKYIENNYTKDFEDGYITTLFNNRGVYNVDGGDSTFLLSQSLKENANKIRELYPYTAKMYDKISQQYNVQSEDERNENE